jgi:hypothetical protein
VPVNLLWHDEIVAQWGPLVVLVLLLLTLSFVAAAGRRLARSDVP